MIENKTKEQREQNRGLRCPYCHQYNLELLYLTKQTITVYQTTTTEKTVQPIICGCCGGMFIRPSDMYQLNEGKENCYV